MAKTTPFVEATEFESFLKYLHAYLLGRTLSYDYKYDEQGKITGVELTEQKRDNAESFVTEEGADYIINCLRFFFNKHLLTSNLTKMDVVNVAYEASAQIAVDLYFHSEKYVANNDLYKISTITTLLFRLLYSYLTSYISAGTREWFVKPYEIKVQQEEPEKKSFFGIGGGEKE
jgi:hypothetical protein